MIKRGDVFNYRILIRTVAPPLTSLKFNLLHGFTYQLSKFVLRCLLSLHRSTSFKTPSNWFNLRFRYGMMWSKISKDLARHHAPGTVFTNCHMGSSMMIEFNSSFFFFFNSSAWWWYGETPILSYWKFDCRYPIWTKDYSMRRFLRQQQFSLIWNWNCGAMHVNHNIKVDVVSVVKLVI